MRPSSAAPAPHRRLVLAAAAVPALFLVALYWPVRTGGLLADDLLLASYAVRPGPDGFEPDWGRVAADFHGPWAFVHGSYYRPLATLTLVLEHWLGGGPEAGHATCLVLGALAVLAVAWACGVLFGPLAAAAGGLWFAAHPALHEPLCWPATRADLLVVAAMAWAAGAFARHLRGEPGRHLAVAHVAFGLALLAKEVGLWTLPWLVLLDLGLRGVRAPLAARLRLYAPFAAIAAAYWLLRWWWLRNPLAEAVVSPLTDPATWLERGFGKVAASVAPYGDWLPERLPWLLAATLLAACASALVRPQSRRWLAVGVVWWLVSLLPAQWHHVSPNLEKGRYLVAGLVGLAIVLAASVGCRGARWQRALPLVALLAALPDLAHGARALQARYHDAWQRLAVLRAQIDEAGARATPERPLVMLTGHGVERGVVFLEATGAFALAQPPLARAEHPFASLGLQLRQGSGPELLEGELATWRQLWRAGASLCYWFDPGANPRLVTVPARDQVGAPRFASAGSGVFRAEQLASPWPIGGLEVAANAPFTRGELVWRTAGGSAGHAAFPAATARDGAFTAIADLHEDGALLVLGTLEGIASVEVALHGDGAPAATALTVVPPDEPVPLRGPLRGARIALAGLGERLPWRELPADADPGSASAVLMTKVCACRVPRPASGPAVLPPRARQELVELERFSRFDRVWYYLECRIGGRRWRSSVDWFERLQGI